jgi:hypothetical protein
LGRFFGQPLVRSDLNPRVHMAKDLRSHNGERCACQLNDLLDPECSAVQTGESVMSSHWLVHFSAGKEEWGVEQFVLLGYYPRVMHRADIDWPGV